MEYQRAHFKCLLSLIVYRSDTNMCGGCCTNETMEKV